MSTAKYVLVKKKKNVFTSELNTNLTLRTRAEKNHHDSPVRKSTRRRGLSKGHPDRLAEHKTVNQYSLNNALKIELGFWYIYIYIYISNIQSTSEDSGCGLFVLRIFE